MILKGKRIFRFRFSFPGAGLFLLTASLLWPFFLGAVDFKTNLPPRELARALTESMDDDQLLGQVLMLGYQGQEASPLFLKWIREKHIGAVKIFGWNGNDLEALTQAIGLMQKEALASPPGIPLIMATDQEGGWVRHVKGSTSITPGNLSIGASGLPWDAYQSGLLIGRELARLGINMNFAPTVDLYLNQNSDIIGPRSFSDDPVSAGVLGTAFFKGLDEAGVISTAKHFPGHGNTEDDSHGILPVIPSTMAYLEEHDLVPYKMMIPAGLPAVMAGHLAFPGISDASLPSSLNPFFLGEILRKRLGFQGVIVTDDLLMAGARRAGSSMAELCETALRAGNDLLLISRNPQTHERIWNHLSRLMKKDRVFRNMVKEKAIRVLKLKAEYLKRPSHVPFTPLPPGREHPLALVQSRDFFFSQAVRGCTLICSKNIPVSPESRLLFLGLHREFRNAGKEFFQGESLALPYRQNPETQSLSRRIIQNAKNYDFVVFNLSRKNEIPLLESLKVLKDKLIILSSLTPVYLKDVPWIQDALAVYGTGKESFQAGMGAIRGDFTPSGRLPIQMKIPGKP